MTIQAQPIISEYEQQALDFLTKYEITFDAKFIENGKHFPDDKEKRDIYELTLAKGNRKIFFRFGQSIAHSKPSKDVLDRAAMKSWGHRAKLLKQVKQPTAYDLLASITKYSPGSFENFCGDFGYDEDSIKANNTYKAVCEEWFKVESFFTDEQLAELQEIN